MVVLVVLSLASALGVVWVHHEQRKVFADWQSELDRRDRLREEWSMLQLEEGAWAGHSRLERVAGDELEMVFPERDEIVILKRP